MKIRIVSYEDVNGWILGKFALNLEKHLKVMGHDVDISKVPDSAADVNHHIIYLNYNNFQVTGGSVNTMMLTHFDDINKINLVKSQLKYNNVGICMSRDTMDRLANYGLPKTKLCFVNPAHDGIIRPKKIKIGLTTRVYRDGCKREGLLNDLIEDIDSDIFRFGIMGDGWQPIVMKMRNKGFDVEYYDTFDYQKYVSLVPEFDYYLYLGQDEGSMGFIDAIAAGVPTITTPQGFHLDTIDNHGLTHSFDTYEELKEVLLSIQSKRLKLIDSISGWSWKDYAIKHLEIWEYLFIKKLGKSKYQDGVNTLLETSIKSDKTFKSTKLVISSYKRKLNRIRNIKSIKDFFVKLKNYYRHN